MLIPILDFFTFLAIEIFKRAKTKFHVKWFYDVFISFLFIHLAKEREIS